MLVHQLQHTNHKRLTPQTWLKILQQLNSSFQIWQKANARKCIIAFRINRSSLAAHHTLLYLNGLIRCSQSRLYGNEAYTHVEAVEFTRNTTQALSRWRARTRRLWSGNVHFGGQLYLGEVNLVRIDRLYRGTFDLPQVQRRSTAFDGSQLMAARGRKENTLISYIFTP